MTTLLNSAACIVIVIVGVFNIRVDNLQDSSTKEKCWRQDKYGLTEPTHSGHILDLIIFKGLNISKVVVIRAALMILLLLIIPVFSLRRISKHKNDS